MNSRDMKHTKAVYLFLGENRARYVGIYGLALDNTEVAGSLVIDFRRASFQLKHVNG